MEPPSAKPDVVRAPWSQEVVNALNAFQRAGTFHPFTCGSGNRADAFHATAVENYGLRDAGQLHATLNGWICPGGCTYTQDWAFEFMTRPLPEITVEERLEVLPDPSVVIGLMDPVDVVDPAWEDRHTRRPAPSEGSRRCMIYRDGTLS